MVGPRREGPFANEVIVLPRRDHTNAVLLLLRTRRHGFAELSARLTFFSAFLILTACSGEATPSKGPAGSGGASASVGATSGVGGGGASGSGGTPLGGGGGVGPGVPDSSVDVSSGSTDGSVGEGAPVDAAASSDAPRYTRRDAAARVDAGPPLDFRFDTTISRVVLENYLSRSISFTELLHDDLSQPTDARGVDPYDNMRLLLDSGVKFVGRALMIWGSENNLSTFLARAKPFIDALHAEDPEIVLQAAAFEIVTQKVETIAVPARVFEQFGLPVVTRNFVYQDMLYANGNQVNHWGSGASVPDMSQLETRMWFYHLTTSYIDVGIEAIHFGQVSLMDQNDRGHVGWLDMLTRVRAYARANARRHMVICDAHTPTGGYVEGGKLLFDAHAFPLRIAEVAGQPFKGVLKVGYADSLYTKSKGGITPSGWSCDHLPYLVEFDNFGSSSPGQSSTAPFIWGWDEITWFATQSATDRDDWLRYASKWLHDNDPVAHLEMPGSRVLSPGAAGGPRWYWANTMSPACPTGSNTEAIIREIWGTGP